MNQRPAALLPEVALPAQPLGTPTTCMVDRRQHIAPMRRGGWVSLALPQAVKPTRSADYSSTLP
ncbi:MAG: hypothetical protein AUH43_26290 [Acidobacteria bacterium 13_1_40CM_65_14]|nr:MAG: hypothetical protein AUH43_26290 [Acidobacteria bacterium 13_1_40CM_65_14]